MHPEQIKAAIRMCGTTPTAIAEELEVSRSMVSHVINGHAKSERIAKKISDVTGMTVETMWPSSGQPTLRRKRETAMASRHTSTSV